MPPTPVDRMTHACENITFPQLRWRVVTNTMKRLLSYLSPLPIVISILWCNFFCWTGWSSAHGRIGLHVEYQVAVFHVQRKVELRISHGGVRHVQHQAVGHHCSKFHYNCEAGKYTLQTSKILRKGGLVAACGNNGKYYFQLCIT